MLLSILIVTVIQSSLPSLTLLFPLGRTPIGRPLGRGCAKWLDDEDVVGGGENVGIPVGGGGIAKSEVGASGRPCEGVVEASVIGQRPQPFPISPQNVDSAPACLPIVHGKSDPCPIGRPCGQANGVIGRGGGDNGENFGRVLGQIEGVLPLLGAGVGHAQPIGREHIWPADQTARVGGVVQVVAGGVGRQSAV